jgi:hypothetical protein
MTDEADFFPLPEGWTLDRKPFTDNQVAELKALFSLSSLHATPPARAVSGQRSGNRTQAA